MGDLIFLAGQGGFEPGTGELVSDDITGQTAQVFRNIEALLQAAERPWTTSSRASCTSVIWPCSRSSTPPTGGISPDRQAGPRQVRADLVAGMLIEVTVIAQARVRARDSAVVRTSAAGDPARAELHPQPDRILSRNAMSVRAWLSDD